MIKSRPAVTEEEKMADESRKEQFYIGLEVQKVMEAFFGARLHKRLFQEGKTSMDHEKIYKGFEENFVKFLSEASEEVKARVLEKVAGIEAADKVEADMDDEAKALIAKGNRLWQKNGKARIYVSGKFSYYDVIEHKYVK